MPSQSKNKPFPIRLEPELYEQVKEDGGGPFVRALLEGFYGGNSLPEIARIERDLERLEELPLAKLELEDVELVHWDLLAVLRFSKKDKLKSHLAYLLLGRLEWLRARKNKRVSRWV